MPLADIYRRQVALLSASCLTSRKEKSFALKGDIAIRPRSRSPVLRGCVYDVVVRSVAETVEDAFSLAPK